MSAPDTRPAPSQEALAIAARPATGEPSREAIDAALAAKQAETDRLRKEYQVTLANVYAERAVEIGNWQRCADSRQAEIDRLQGLLDQFTTGLSVEEARRQGVCRVCGQPHKLEWRAWNMDEHAHVDCLEKERGV